MADTGNFENGAFIGNGDRTLVLSSHVKPFCRTSPEEHKVGFRTPDAVKIDYKYQATESDVLMTKDGHGLSYVGWRLGQLECELTLLEPQGTIDLSDLSKYDAIVAVGSRLSNLVTWQILTEKLSRVDKDRVRFVFTEDSRRKKKHDYIVYKSETTGRGNRVGTSDLASDYAAITYFVADGKKFLVLAGLGPQGTLAACYRFFKHYEDLVKKHETYVQEKKGQGFFEILKVSRDGSVIDPAVHADGIIGVTPAIAPRTNTLRAGGNRNDAVVFRWLHFTDLHYADRLAPQWHTIDAAMKDDLREVASKTGRPWDFILFTGDLVQTGDPSLYRSLSERLGNWWDFFRQEDMGNPYLITVPGNHDLVLQDHTDPDVVRLLKYYADSKVEEEFWTEPSGKLRAVVDRAFDPYVKWEGTHGLGPRLTRVAGALPGDGSWVVAKDGFRLGLVGLNSAFLQLVKGPLFAQLARDRGVTLQDEQEPFRGQLALDQRQLSAACGGDPMKWRNNADIALLLTHHPVNWLHGEAHKRFLRDIYDQKRFVAQVFGHMHEAFEREVSEGGAEPRRYWQAVSLFSSELLSAGGDRRRGYTAGRVAIRGKNASFRLWPRLATVTQDRKWELDRDTTFKKYSEDDGTMPVVVSIR